LARKSDIRLRRSAVSGSVPSTTDLNLGELAINTYDGKLFLKKDVSGTETVVEVGGNKFGTIAVSGQSDVVADSANDTLTFAAGSGMTITTDASTDTVTLTASSSTQQTAIWKEYVYTATTNQTSFSGSDDNSQTLSYVAGYLQVFLNGVLLDNGTDYTATNGTTVTLVNGAASGDLIQIATFVKVLGTGDAVTDEFTGDGNTAAYTLSADPDVEDNTMVFIDGVYQEKGTYTVSGTTLTFDSNVPNGASIEVVIGSRNVTVEDVQNLTVEGDLTVQGESFFTGDAEFTGYVLGDVKGAVAFAAQAGEALSKGDVVYISGISGNTTIVLKADADDTNKMPAFGVASTSASINAAVNIITYGILSNINTGSYTEGDELFVSTTAGVLTNTPPAGEAAALQKIAKVTRADATVGSIFITGAGRTNAVPNLDDGDIFIGNASNQASTAALDTSIVPENTNLYHTTERVQDVTGGQFVTNGTHTGISFAYDDAGDGAIDATVSLASFDTDDLSEGLTNLYYTDARARGAISVTDSGGDGSLTYNSGTGVITYTGPSASEVRAHFSAGTGVTLSSGQISIGQAVETTSDVQFNDVQIDGDLIVSGTTTTINTATLSVADNIVVLNSDVTGTPTENAGIEVERGTSTNVLVRWNETSDIWEFTNDGSTYYPIPTDTDDLTEGSTNLYYTDARADARIAAATTDDLTEGSTNLYYTNARADARIALQVGANLDLSSKDTDDLSEGASNLYYTDARVSTRVDTILNHSNHTNISVSKVGNELRLSAASSYGDSDVESYLDGGTSTPVLSNTDVNGTLNISGTVSLDGTANELRFYEGANYVGFEAPALSGDQIWVLPDSDGTAGYALKTDGAGNLSWGLAGGNAFETIAIAGQSSVVADSSSDTLTLAAGTGIAITTNASTDTITITNNATGDNAFGNIAVSGQTTVAADSTNDTLTLVGQNGVSITTDASTDTVTIDGRTSYSPFTTDLFTTADAVTTDFVLSVTPSSEDNLIVFVEGVYQNKNSYSLSSNTLTLSGAPGSGEEVVVHIVSDLISGQALVRNNFTGDNSTTDFTLTIAPMNANNTFVYFDGVYQEKSEYSVSGTTLSFNTAPALNDSIEVIIPKTTELQQPAVGSIDDAAMYDTTAILPQTVTSTTVASTSATTIATHSASTYRTIKYLVQCTQGTDYHSTEINLIHDGTTVYITEYGTLFDNASLGTFNATISSGNILLQITPGSATSMAVKVMSSAIPV